MASKAEYNKLAAEESAASMVEVPLTPQPTEPAPRGMCFTDSCCCCFSAATGVKILACFEVLHAVTALLSALVIVLAKTHEHAIDQAFAPVASDFFNMTAAQTAEQISVLNHGIDLMAARALPFVLLSALCFFWVGHMGLKAARGDVRAARFYFFWKVAGVVIAAFSASLGSFLLAAYFAVVVRSHYINCKEKEEALPTTSTAPPSYNEYVVSSSAGNIQSS